MITVEQLTALLGILGGIVALIVGILTILSNRDSKTANTATTAQSLNTIQTSLNELKVDVKSEFKTFNSKISDVDNKLSSLTAKVELQQASLSKAHERIDEIVKGV